MATELELKLMVHPSLLAQAAAFFDHYCRDAVASHRQPTLSLMNAYYDTEDGLLMRSGIALRIRAVNQRFIQTLKTRGTQKVGMHERGEWEWELAQDQLDFSLLTQAMVPPTLHDGQWQSQVLLAFRTDFERQIWQINLPNTQIEAVCDLGQVSSAYGKDDICEIELELKTGDDIGLFDLAMALAKEVPVQMCTVSKAQRGVRLRKPEIELPAPVEANADDLTSAAYWFEVWLTYWEAIQHRQQGDLVLPMVHAMQQLASLLPNDLAVLIEKNLPDGLHLAPQALLQRYQDQVQTTSIGICMLSVGRWLHHQ